MVRIVEITTHTQEDGMEFLLDAAFSIVAAAMLAFVFYGLILAVTTFLRDVANLIRRHRERQRSAELSRQALITRAVEDVAATHERRMAQISGTLARLGTPPRPRRGPTK